MKEITLRQAHKLVEKLNARIASIELDTTIEVSIWDYDPAAVTSARVAFNEQTRRLTDLASIRQTIRNMIRIANQQAVDDLITKRKELIDTIGVLRTIVQRASTRTMYTPEALAQKVQATRTAQSSGSSYGTPDTLSVSVLDVSDVERFTTMVEQTQLKIEQVEDQLTRVNSSTMITLSDEVFEQLKKENLIV